MTSIYCQNGLDRVYSAINKFVGKQGLNEEAGYKRARPGRKQCLFYHIRHMSQYGCITKIREFTAMAPAINFYT